MRMFFKFVAFMLLACAMPLQAQSNDWGLDPATLDETGTDAVNLAGSRGYDMYFYDQAAWHTTDAMKEDITDPAGMGINGWVVTREEKGLRVTYWKPDGDTQIGVYSALYNGSVSESRVLEGEAATLSEEQLSLIEAQLAVNLQGIYRCSEKPFNSITLPPEKEGDPILFYLLTAQSSNSSVPAGGHFIFEVQDGKVVAQRSFTNSCLDLQTRNLEDGSELKAVMVSHLLDPQPTELHVFMALTTKIPLIVMTAENRRVWTISLGDSGQPQIYLAGSVPKDD